MAEILWETVLERRARPQPDPPFNPGGDCAACCLAGLMDMEVAEVVERWPEHASWSSRGRVLRQLRAEGRIDLLLDDPPSWPVRVNPAFMTFGLRAIVQSSAWFRYIRLGLEAGCYALAGVDFDKKGAQEDHLVMIVGARKVLGDDAYRYDVLVSCSSRSTPELEWVPRGDFLTERGGFNAILARPV